MTATYPRLRLILSSQKLKDLTASPSSEQNMNYREEFVKLHHIFDV